jgi:hypothetical protein
VLPALALRKKPWQTYLDGAKGGKPQQRDGVERRAVGDVHSGCREKPEKSDDAQQRHTKVGRFSLAQFRSSTHGTFRLYLRNMIPAA